MDQRSMTPAASRRRLWELPAEWHEPILGSNWSVAELRRLTDRLFAGRSSLGDIELYRAAVAQCAGRNRLSQALQRDLDRRHADALRRHAAADAAALGLWWSEALRDGQVGAALWVMLGHPQCDDALGRRVLQQLQLHQHERVAARRRELAAAGELRAEIAALRDETQRAHQRQAQWHREAAAQREAQQAQLAALRGRLLAQDTLIAQLRARPEPEPEPEPPRPEPKLQPPLPWPPSVEIVTRVADLAPRPAEPPSLAADALRSASVLCVGGRHGHVPQYRELVERHGGRFAHHDGGIEDSVHRLDAQLAAADVVLCQSGCLNHNAYARVKAHCKRSGKPCVYLDNPGAGSFLRGLARVPARGSETAID